MILVSVISLLVSICGMKRFRAPVPEVGRVHVHVDKCGFYRKTYILNRGQDLWHEFVGQCRWGRLSNCSFLIICTLCISFDSLYLIYFT